MLTALALAATARPVAAQTLPLLPSLGLGVHGGVFSPQDGDSGGFGGVHARLRLLPFFGIEAASDVRETHAKENVTVLQVPVQLSALLYLIPFGPLQLYFGGGVGYYYLHVDPKDASSQSTDSVGYHGGGGIDIPLIGTRWVLNADARYYVLDGKVQGRPSQEIDLDGWQIRGGLTYYFW